MPQSGGPVDGIQQVVRRCRIDQMHCSLKLFLNLKILFIDDWRKMSIEELAKQQGRGLAFEVYALRDIQPGMLHIRCSENGFKKF